MKKFLENIWYVAAWSHELGEKPLGRTLVDLPVVLFRTAAGEVAALYDSCPHRFVALSLGKVKGDTIQCGYHGLQFRTNGACAKFPFAQPDNPNAKVRSFPVKEKDGLVWFWPGDPARADASLIPDLSVNTDPAYQYARGVTRIQAGYELLNDNLLDLTHARYLHPDFGGEDFWIPEVSFKRTGDDITGTYVVKDLPPTPLYESALYEPSNGRHLRETSTITWTAPSVCVLYVDWAWEEIPEVRFSRAPGLHIATPETASSFHYFWTQGLDAGVPMDMEEFGRSIQFAFETEDGVFLESAQRELKGRDFWEMNPAVLKNDRGAILARRILKQRLRAEEGGEDRDLSAHEDLSKSIGTID